MGVHVVKANLSDLVPIVLVITCTCVFIMSLYMFYECVEQLHFDSFSQVQ